MATLMAILNACENDLGWVPEGPDRIKSRAVMHHVLTKAMTKKHLTEADLSLTVAYCRRKRLPLVSPLQLLTLSAEAKDAAGPTIRPHDLDTATQAARDWEATRADAESRYWTGRLVRCVGPARADVLDEWRQAGRG